MTEVVMATGLWKTNAELIRDAVVPLGYLAEGMRVVDPTYGLGRFWSLWRPWHLSATDLNPAKSPTGTSVDMRALPYPADHFDAGVLDGPYKLNGTSTGRGAASCDGDYGVDEPARWQDRHELICGGITEQVRVIRPGGRLLVKCQDQVCSGAVRWQTDIFTRHAESLGCRKIDRFDLVSYRPQPAARRQLHARRNTSALLVFEVPRG